MLKWIEKLWNRLNISREKIHVIRRFKTSCLLLSLIPRDTPSFLMLGIAFVLLGCLPCQATKKLREMLEMIGTEMSSVIPHFKPIYISKLLCQAVMCKINTDLLDEKRRLSAV